jgi:hypothetical protein
MADSKAVTAAVPSEYVKAIVAIIGSFVVIVLQALASGGNVTPLVVITGIIAAVTVVPVAWFSQAYYTKAIAAGVIAAIQLLVTLVGPSLGWGDVNSINWASVILAFVTAAGVGIIPNKQIAVATQQVVV